MDTAASKTLREWLENTAHPQLILADIVPADFRPNQLQLVLALLLARSRSKAHEGEKTAAAEGAAHDGIAAQQALWRRLEDQGVSRHCTEIMPASFARLCGHDSVCGELLHALFAETEHSCTLVRVAAGETPTMPVPIGPDGLESTIAPVSHTKIEVGDHARARFVYGCLGRGQSAAGRLDLIEISLGRKADLELVLFSRSAQNAPIGQIIAINAPQESRIRVLEAAFYGGPSYQRITLSAAKSSSLTTEALVVCSAHEGHPVTQSVLLDGHNTTHAGLVVIIDPANNLSMCTGETANASLRQFRLSTSSDNDDPAHQEIDRLIAKFPPEYALEARTKLDEILQGN